jgi:uncharacterized protein
MATFFRRAHMSRREHDRRIDYLELPATNVGEAKRFYAEVFGWGFEDYGPDYTCFQDGRLSGAFYAAPAVTPGGPLIVIYAADLDAVESKVTAAGGVISKPTFEFPGGKRFHFVDPGGCELAVWSDA